MKLRFELPLAPPLEAEGSLDEMIAFLRAVFVPSDAELADRSRAGPQNPTARFDSGARLSHVGPAVVCPRCGRIFGSKRALAQHARWVHRRKG